MHLLHFVAILGVLAPLARATTIYVPDDYASIQAAIDASADGDTILVRPGTYLEYIDFKGRAITLKSTSGPDVTTIDANQVWSVVTFASGEGAASVLDGFTLTNGKGTTGAGGGGILCNAASPTIRNNVITANHVGSGSGGGIGCIYGSHPIIIDNVIIGNSCNYGVGGGVYCSHSSSPLIERNVISGNGALRGGGLGAYNNCAPTVRNNVLANNSTNGNGGGIYFSSSCIPVVSNCSLVGNYTNGIGGGIYCEGSSSLELSDSIVWNNTASAGHEVALETSSSLTVSYCDVEGGLSDVSSDPSCTVTWGAGMIDTDPLFIDPANGDYHLRQDPPQAGVVNPCVDTGDSGSALLAGSTRSDGVADSGVVDMGYHYTEPVSPLPNLVPWQPAGWSGVIVVSGSPGTHLDDNLGAGQTIYIDFAELNDGAAAVAHTTRLTIAGVPLVDEPVPALPPYGGQEWSDVAYVFPAPGTYRVQIDVDVFDDEDNESSELDNSYWRDVEVHASAAATFRNTAPNPASYDTTTLPVLGTVYECTVDLAGTTGHSFAQLFGFGSPFTFTLGGGQVLLLNPTDPAGELTGGPVGAGSLVTFSLPIPGDVALAGFTLSTQAAHLFGVAPFALSNAQDLVLGY